MGLFQAFFRTASNFSAVDVVLFYRFCADVRFFIFRITLDTIFWWGKMCGTFVSNYITN